MKTTKPDVQDIDTLCISLPLAEHPVRNAKYDVRQNYIGILQYFINQFATNKKWSDAALNAYCKSMSVENQSISDVDSLSQYIKTIKTNLFDRIFKKQPSTATLNICLAYDIFFLTSFNNKKAAQQVCEFVTPHISKRYKKHITMLRDVLFNGAETSTKQLKNVEYLINCWHKNIEFLNKNVKRILVTGTMSSGKSSVINALVGKKVAKTSNMACTANISYIYDKTFEDDYTYFHQGDSVNIINRENNNEILIRPSEESYIATNIDTPLHIICRICFIDTPGTNVEKHPEHRKITENKIKQGCYDIIFFVFNANQPTVTSDTQHLLYTLKNNRESTEILFLLNKCDDPDIKEVDAIISDIRKLLASYGVQDSTIYPIASEAAILAKQNISKGLLDEGDKRLHKKYLDYLCELGVINNNDQTEGSYDTKLLMYSGIPELERMLTQIFLSKQQ